MDTPVMIVLVIALLAAIGVAVWLYMQKRRSDGLRTSFGSEYDCAREEHPDQRSAERELTERKERVEGRAGGPEERERPARLSAEARHPAVAGVGPAHTAMPSYRRISRSA